MGDIGHVRQIVELEPLDTPAVVEAPSVPAEADVTAVQAPA